MPSAETACRVDLGQQTEATATIAVQSDRASSEATWKGTVRGPSCRFARTLAADYRVEPNGVAVITEPCYWTPRMPFLYQLRAELVVGDAVVATIEQPIGLRRLDVQGSNLSWEGRRTVLRGCRLESMSDGWPTENPIAGRVAEVLEEARAAEAAVWTAGYDVAVGRVAAEIGTPLIVDLRGRPVASLPALLSPALAPAVVATIVDQPPKDADWAASGWLGAQALALDDAGRAEPPSRRLADWARLAVVEFAEGATLPSWVAELEQPVIASCPAARPQTISAARRLADQLQAALAPQFDFAGYFVSALSEKSAEGRRS